MAIETLKLLKQFGRFFVSFLGTLPDFLNQSVQPHQNSYEEVTNS